MKFDTKIAIVLREGLESWQALNVTAFLTSGIAATEPVMGEPYVDGDGVTYLPMIRQPVLIFCADADGIQRAFERASRRELPLTLFTEDLFATGHDGANRAAVAAVRTDGLRLVGFATHGPKSVVDRCLKGLGLHP